jgi:membrane protease YdiL (CAAX protease family)
MQYPAHDAFVAPARARPELWRLALGLGLILTVYVLAIAALFGVIAGFSGLDGARAWMARMAGTGTPTSTLLVLATFIGMALGPLLAARLLHRRRIGGLFGPRARLLRGFAIGFGICAGLYAALSLLPTESPYSRNLDLSLWLAFLPLALVGILIQTGAEEVLFRGYLQQQLAARFASPWAWMVLPSAVFAVLHYNPVQMGGNAWIVVLAVFLFAVLAADLTARTGSIGAAWGFHFANNAVAILFVAMEGPLSGLALYTMPAQDMTDAALRPLLFVNMGMTVLTWGLIRWAVRR